MKEEILSLLVSWVERVVKDEKNATVAEIAALPKVAEVILSYASPFLLDKKS